MANRLPRRFLAYSQRLAYLLIAVAIVVAVGAATVAGFRLRHSVQIQRQTLRAQQLDQTTLALQNFALEARSEMGVSAALAARRAQGLAEANAAFAAVEKHHPAEAARLSVPYHAFVAAANRSFAEVERTHGAVPASLAQKAQLWLGRLQNRIGAAVSSQATASQRANPAARTALIVAAIAAAAVILLLIWQFEHERRAGRIDRDNAARAEELARLRDEFVAVVSHELRTPLTSIAGYLELLDDDGTDNLTADQESYLAVVRRSTQRLGELVGDLLLVAESERAPLSLEIGDVDVATLATHAVEAAQPSADARGVELRAETTSASVQGDPTRLAQMLDNLVSNAIKFTPEGGLVTVRAGSGAGSVVFEVSDTGDGIGLSDRARLFEPFFRSREATTRAVPGTGLGLTIAKAIVDAHRGTIEIESSREGGTTFRVRIPAREHVPAGA